MLLRTLYTNNLLNLFKLSAKNLNKFLSKNIKKQDISKILPENKPESIPRC